MLIQEKSFDGYIGVIVEFDPSRGRRSWNGQYLVHADFYTVPVRKDHGRVSPRWDRKTPVPNNLNHCGFFVPEEYWGTTEATAMFIREQCENILQEVEDYFCKIGQCKINAAFCPERKMG